MRSPLETRFPTGGGGGGEIHFLFFIFIENGALAQVKQYVKFAKD